MLNSAMGWLKARCPVLFDDKMPVWLTIVASLAAAGLTYYFAPMFTRQFQIEDVRSAHLKQTTDQLNSEIIELSQKVRRFDSALVNKSKEAASLREDCLDLITKLQWRLVDLKVILSSPSDEVFVTDVSNSLEKLRISLNATPTKSYREGVHAGMAQLAKATANVLNRLYSKASLQG
jgi:hypothetical protein